MQKQDWRRVGAIVVAVGAIAALVALVLRSPDGDDGLEGEVWVVDQLTVDGISEASIPGTILTAVFEDGVVSGVAGCNEYSGGYEVDGDTIDVTEIASTRAFCGEPVGTMDQEITYLGLLQTADGFERDGDGLTLRDGANPLIILAAARAEPRPE